MSLPQRMPNHTPTRLSRRRFLGLGSRADASGATPPAGPDAVSHPSGQRWTAHQSADMPPPDPVVHLLNRAAFGAAPQDLAQARAMGVEAWVDAQLNFEAIDDSAVEGPLAAGLPSLAMSLNDLSQLDQHTYRVTDALNAATFYRQAFSPRQLYEVMVDFWTDHFSIYQLMENAEVFKSVDDREVIRKHALGRFKDLLTASAHSPAMLRYLNNDENTKDHPNENYAREIMELHTLGVAVNGVPYTEADVLEVARCFTGWTWNRTWNDPVYGTFLFVPDRHDRGVKHVLGTLVPAQGGQQDGLTVIDRLCDHPATARFLALKLVRRFVADDPLASAPALVDRVADAYTRTDGDIKAMVREVLVSPELAGAFGRHGGKLTRPMDVAVRMMRAAGVPQAAIVPRLGDHAYPFQAWYFELVGYQGFMRRMGHIPFGWLTPDGYPDVKEPWASAVGMLSRWNMALALATGGLVPGFRPHEYRPRELASPEAVVDHWIDALLHRPMLPEDREVVLAFYSGGGAGGPATPPALREAQTVALVLASPYFQWR